MLQLQLEDEIRDGNWQFCMAGQISASLNTGVLLTKLTEHTERNPSLAGYQIDFRGSLT